MIPKIIHYCWFGQNPIPSLERKCMDSWTLKLPDYKIIRWDESNFDFNQFEFTKLAYDKGKFAFVADVARIYALVTEGGFYLDTDIEVLKSFDSLLDNSLIMGFETDNVIQTGLIGAERAHPILIEMLNDYSSKTNLDYIGSGLIANSTLFANKFRNMGIPLNNQNFHSESLTLLASEYFCPINQATWEIKPTENSYAIHYLSGSWLPTSHKLKRRVKALMGKTCGFDFVEKLRNLLK